MPNLILFILQTKIYIYSIFSLFLPPPHITHFAQEPLEDGPKIYIHKYITGGRSVHDLVQKLLSSRTWDRNTGVLPAKDRMEVDNLHR